MENESTNSTTPPAEPIRFSALSAKQQEVLGEIAIGMDGQHHPDTLQALLKKGLIEESEEVMRGRFPVRIKRYSMPLWVHIQWCGWCTAQESEAK